MLNYLKDLFICSLVGHKFFKSGKYLQCKCCNKLAVLEYNKGDK